MASDDPDAPSPISATYSERGHPEPSALGVEVALHAGRDMITYQRAGRAVGAVSHPAHGAS